MTLQEIINNNFRMSKLTIITLYKLYAVQAQAVQENGKRPRAGCNIQLIKMIQDMICIRQFTVMNILG